MLEVEQAGFRYNGGGWVFRKHSFRLEPGEITAILGPNGRGKTTLLKTVVGLLKLDEGRISLLGETGYVPQDSWTPFPYSVLDMVVMGRARHIGMFSSPTRADFRTALEFLELLGALRFKDRVFTSLSGGERQIVLIARALASGCGCLLLDEPASALDFKNQEVILKTLRLLSREKGLTVLLTTHYPQHAVHIADKALLMYDPEHYEFGPVGRVMNDETLGRLYGMDIRNINFQHAGREIHTVVPVFS